MMAAIGRLFGRTRGASESAHGDLAQRIEQRSLVATLEAMAYTEHCIQAMPSGQIEYGAQIEGRALLATQEAKAYADQALESLSMALRGMSSVVVQLSHRVARLEAGTGSVETSDALAAETSGNDPSAQSASHGSTSDVAASSSQPQEMAQVVEQLNVLVVATRNLDAAMAEMRSQISALQTDSKTAGQPNGATDR